MEGGLRSLVLRNENVFDGVVEREDGVSGGLAELHLMCGEDGKERRMLGP